jgi:hypothetical protein
MMELSRLTKDEAALLEAFAEGKSDTIEVILPDTLSAKDVVKYADSAAKMLKRNDSERGVLLAAMGRLLFLAQSRPEILAMAKCLTIEDFMERMGVTASTRASVYAASKAYREFPGLSPNQYAEIGSTKLAIASREAKGKSENQKAEILEHASDKTKSVEEFRTWVENESGTSGPGETTISSFGLIGSLAEIKELREFLAEQAFVDWAGDSRPIAMVLAAIKNASSEFMAQAEEDSIDADYAEMPEPVQEVYEEINTPTAVARDGEPEF